MRQPGNYLSQWFKDKSSEVTATPVTVVAGASATPSVNATLQSGGSISGKVTASSGGAALGTVCVYAAPTTGTTYGEATTASTGTYTIRGLASGKYTVEFYPCNRPQNYLSQWFHNKATSANATPVTVVAGGSPASASASLLTGGGITGKVTAASGGAPLSTVCVEASPLDTESYAYATTASDGTYAIVGLATGSYRVVFYPCEGNALNYLDQWYKDADIGDKCHRGERHGGDDTHPGHQRVLGGRWGDHRFGPRQDRRFSAGHNLRGR